MARILFDVWDDSPLESDTGTDDHIHTPFATMYSAVASADIYDSYEFLSEFSALGSEFCGWLLGSYVDTQLVLAIGCVVTPVPGEIESDELPRSFGISPNFPNPFNSSTAVRIDVPHRTDLAIAVYNIKGQVVFNQVREQVSAGMYYVNLNFDNLAGTPLASGVYLLKVAADEETVTRKMIFLK